MLVLAPALALALSCAGPSGAPVPDFSLEDDNPSSPSYLQTVSPREELDKVSAWYFGHST